MIFIWEKIDQSRRQVFKPQKSFFVMQKFYWQERVWTCGPAAFRIALSNLGIEKSEKYLSELLGANPRHGVPNRTFFKVAKKFNLRSRGGTGNLKLLRKLSSENWSIIVNYYAFLHGAGHFAAVKKIFKDKIYLLDPASGPNQAFSLKYFNKIWHGQSHKSRKWFFAIKRN